MFWSATGYFLLVCLVNLFHDRYLLVLAPLLIAMQVSVRGILRPAVSFVLVAVMGIASTVEMRDYLEFDRALWGAVEQLRQRGARDWEINAGYFANNWLWVAHGDHAPRTEDGEIMPRADPRLLQTQRFTLANSPLPNHKTVRVIPYRSWLGSDGIIYVLENEKLLTAR